MPNNGLLIDVGNLYENGLDTIALDFDYKNVFSKYIDKLRLPYDCTALEFDYILDEPHPQTIIAEQLESGIRITAFCKTSMDKWSALPWATYILEDFRVEFSTTENKLIDDKSVKAMQHTFIYALLCFLAALNCSNVKQYVLPKPKIPVNSKGKPKQGKQPFFSYKILTIDTQSQQPQSNTTGGGTHASPRVHLRRGHIRRLPNKTVWVNACVVGDKSKGMVHKDYNVV